MALQMLYGPIEEPYTRSDAKLSWRITIDDDDALVDVLIAASRENTETYTHRQILTATYALYMDRFPSVGDSRFWWPYHSYYGIDLRQLRNGSIIELPRPPLQAVTKITYMDESRVEQTLSTDAYGVDLASEPGRVYLKRGHWWPATLEEPNAVRVEYIAGWPTIPDVPRALIVGMKLLGGWWYELREAALDRTMLEAPLGTKILVNPYRIVEAY